MADANELPELEDPADIQEKNLAIDDVVDDYSGRQSDLEDQIMATDENIAYYVQHRQELVALRDKYADGERVLKKLKV